MTVRAVLVDDLLTEDAPTGAIKFTAPEGVSTPTGMNFVCPCGCGKIGGVSFPPWTFDGNREAPTIRASIHFEQGRPGEWHGFLTAGEWQAC